MPYAFGRKSSLLLSGILSLGLLAGCAPAPGSSKTPAASVYEFTGPSSPADHQNTDDLPLLLVPGLDAVTQSNEHHRIFTRHFEVPADPVISRSQRELAKDQIAAFTSDNVPDITTGELSVAELNLRSHLTAVSTNVVGIRVETYVSTGVVGGTSYLTQWFDQRATHALGSRDLFGSDEDWELFKEFVVQAATKDPRVFAGGLMDLDDSLLDSVNFDRSGNATVEFDDNALGPASSGPIVVEVEAAHIAGLLSRFGALARTASTSPSPRVQLGLLHDAAEPPREGNDLAAESGPDALGQPSPRTIDCTVAKCVALTFDDGPGPKTGKLLDTLKDSNAPSTFFVTGSNAKHRPRLLARMLAEGHEIGNHTWNHRSLTSLSSTRIRREIDRTNEVITQAAGQPATLLRPPYGAHNSISDRLSSTPVILWDVDTLDWKHRDTEKVVEAAITQTTPGSIVLMHDIHSSTVAAVPRILSGLRAKGYTFVTVTELLGPTGLEAGKSHARAPGNAKPDGGDGRARHPGEVRYP